MSIWKADLTTEDGALGAAQMGAYACFVAAVLSAITLVMVGGLSPSGLLIPVFAVAVGLVETLVYLVAGFRLHAGKGVAWGSAAAALLGLELLLKIVTVAISIGLFVNVLLLVVTINGIRGALAMRAGKFDTGDAEEIFR